jgi:hypothetical protein
VYSGKNASQNVLPPLYFYPKDGNKLLIETLKWGAISLWLYKENNRLRD